MCFHSSARGLLGAAPFGWGWRVSVPADLPDAVGSGPEGVVVIAELACPLLVEVTGRGVARGPCGGFDFDRYSSLAGWPFLVGESARTAGDELAIRQVPGQTLVMPAEERKLVTVLFADLVGST